MSKKLLEQRIDDAFAADADAVREMLERYRHGDLYDDVRVKLAIVKLADGDVDDVEPLVEQANQDPRDVLAWAESPRQMESPAGSGHRPADRREYDEWLRSGESVQGLRQALHRAAGISVDLLSDLEGTVDPGGNYRALTEAFTRTIDDDGVGLMGALEEFENRVLPHAMRPANPMYFGLVNSSPLPGAVLGELLVAALDSNAGAFHHTRSITPIEDELVRFFSTLAYGDGEAAGQLVPAGSYANLQALLLARTYAENDAGDPRLYVSDSVHFSVTRAARTAGIEDWLVPVRSDARGGLDADALQAQIETDIAAGRTPAAVFATAGTTGTGAIDPLDRVARLSEKYEMWLHVDACYGGGALLLDELRPRFGGIERADSVSIDPHKWFFMPLAAGLLLTRHPDLELQTFDPAGASYIPSDGPPGRYRRGISASRRASALSIWMGLRAHGVGTIRDAVRRNIALTRELESLLDAEGFRVLSGGELSVACARWEPDNGKDLDALQTRIAADAVGSGRTWFGTTEHAGETWLRFNIVNLHTRGHHLARLVDLLKELGRLSNDADGATR